MPSLRSINREAGTSFRRWKELTEYVKGDWHPQIHRPTAEREGLTPAAFTWLNYPVTNVVFRHPVYGESSRWNIRWSADMPPDTPQLNFYEEDGTRRPEPRGSALARVEFSLIDLADGETLFKDGRVNHFDGAVEGGMTEGGEKLWERLPPGASIQVRLDAQPFFFPYNDPDKGDGGNHYAAVNNGYLNGETASSPVYTLAMTWDNEFLIDGQPAPPDPEAPEHPSVAEGDRIMAAERAAREAQEEAERLRLEEENRLYEAQLERERLAHEAEQQRYREEAEQERLRREREAIEEEERRQQAAVGIVEYTLLDQMRDGFKDTPDGEVKAWIESVLSYGGEYEEAGRAYAQERGITI